MSSTTPSRDDQEPPRNELTALLWVIAVMLAVIEVTWLALERIFSA
jgi:cytochrome c-type biogenesis protein CcmH/NrfF